MKRIILASHNEHKIEELKAILNLDNFQIVGLKDVDFYDEIDETGSSFIENSMIKAMAVWDKISESMTEDDFIVADDSGLCCDILDGAPGIFSARFAGKVSNDEKNQLLIKMLKESNFNESTWNAHYTAAITVIDKCGSKCIFEDYCHGKIISKPSGDHGFGFDPIFYLDEYSCTMAELPSDTKNLISHRAKTCEKVRRYLLGFN